MEAIMQMLLAPSQYYNLYKVLSIVLLSIIAVVALMVIVLVVILPSASSGIDAINGNSETFFGKNKGRTMESKMKLATAIGLVIIGVLSVVFYVLQLLP